MIHDTMHTLVLSHKCFVSYFGVIYIPKIKRKNAFKIFANCSTKIFRNAFLLTISTSFLSSGASLL